MVTPFGSLVEHIGTWQYDWFFSEDVHSHSLSGSVEQALSLEPLSDVSHKMEVHIMPL